MTKKNSEHLLKVVLGMWIFLFLLLAFISYANITYFQNSLESSINQLAPSFCQQQNYGEEVWVFEVDATKERVENRTGMECVLKHEEDCLTQRRHICIKGSIWSCNGKNFTTGRYFSDSEGWGIECFDGEEITRAGQCERDEYGQAPVVWVNDKSFCLETFKSQKFYWKDGKFHQYKR